MPTVAEAFAAAADSYAQGNLPRADEYARAVLNADPSHADAWHMLGLIAWQKGDRPQAMDFLQRSVSLNDANADAWKTLGDMHASLGNYRVAMGDYQQALRVRPDFAVAHNHLGIALQELGQWPGAVAAHQQAVCLAPTYAAAYNNLGNALKGNGQFAEAVAAFKQACALQSDRADFVYNLGVALHEQGQSEKAVEHYREALRLRPDYPDASNNLATAYKELGRLDEAIAQFRETLRLQPNHALAVYNLGRFAAEGRYPFTAEEMARVQSLMASERSSVSERSLYGFALGTVLDKQGAYDEAFAYFREANDLKRRLMAEQNLAFDQQGHRALIEQVIATFNEGYFARVRGWGVETDMPVFVIGMPRSGSTLVEQILASHPAVFGAGEVGEVPLFVSRVVIQAGPNLFAAPPFPDPGTANAVAADYLARMTALAHGASRVTIKTLENFMSLGVIATLFPRARVIHCRRDPLDVCLSCYFQNFSSDFTWSLDDIGVYYRAYEKLMAHWANVLPLEIHEVSYENLIEDQEAVTRRLLAYCGLDWDERCLRFWTTRRAVQTASAVQVRKPISKNSLGRWKHYREHLGPLLEALGMIGER